MRINLDQAKPSTFGRSICCCFQFHSRHRFFHTAGNFPVITFQTSITQLFPFLHFYCQIFSNKFLLRICVFMARLKLHHRQSLKFLFSNIHKLKNCFFCSWLMMMAFSMDRIVPRTNQPPIFFWKITAQKSETESKEKLTEAKHFLSWLHFSASGVSIEYAEVHAGWTGLDRVGQAAWRISEPCKKPKTADQLERQLHPGENVLFFLASLISCKGGHVWKIFSSKCWFGTKPSKCLS